MVSTALQRMKPNKLGVQPVIFKGHKCFQNIYSKIPKQTSSCLVWFYIFTTWSVTIFQLTKWNHQVLLSSGYATFYRFNTVSLLWIKHLFVNFSANKIEKHSACCFFLHFLAFFLHNYWLSKANVWYCCFLHPFWFTHIYLLLISI